MGEIKVSLIQNFWSRIGFRKLLNQIVFNPIRGTLFRHLVITRLCYPTRKLITADYLYKYKGVSIDVERIYRYLDNLHRKQKDLVIKLSLAGGIS